MTTMARAVSERARPAGSAGPVPLSLPPATRVLRPRAPAFAAPPVCAAADNQAPPVHPNQAQRTLPVLLALLLAAMPVRLHAVRSPSRARINH